MATLISWQYGPLLIAFGLLLLFVLLFWRSRWISGGLVRKISLGSAVLGIAFALFLAVGAIIYQVQSATEKASFAMPGELVDVGGYNIHISCEGNAREGDPTIIWLSGGYSSGLSIWGLQQAWKSEGRSCIIDRAGTGWSDEGPDPRSVKQIVTEFENALAGSGESGPFIVGGHSLGGLLSVNWAARYPDRFIGLIALDPTPREMIDTGGVRQPGGWCRAEVPMLNMTLSAFGLGHMFPGLHPMNDPNIRAENATLMPVWQAIKATESSPSKMMIDYKHNIFTCFSGYDLIRAPGSLGDLPVLSITQKALKGTAEERANAETIYGIDDDVEWQNFKASMAAALEEYPRFSSNGKWEAIPGDWGHNFPVSHPDFVVNRTRRFIDETVLPAATKNAKPTMGSK